LLYRFLRNLRNQKRRRTTLTIRSTWQNSRRPGCEWVNKGWRCQHRARWSHRAPVWWSAGRYKSTTASKGVYAGTACHPVGSSFAGLARGSKNTRAASAASATPCSLLSGNAVVCRLLLTNPCESKHITDRFCELQSIACSPIVHCCLQIRRIVSERLHCFAIVQRPASRSKWLVLLAVLARSARAGLSLPCPDCVPSAFSPEHQLRAEALGGLWSSYWQAVAVIVVAFIWSDMP